MAKRKQTQPSETTESTAAQSTPSSDRPHPVTTSESTATHGPARPARTVYGVARLRATMHVTDAVAVDDLCEEAALTIEKLREDRPTRLRWRED